MTMMLRDKGSWRPPTTQNAPLPIRLIVAKTDEVKAQIAEVREAARSAVKPRSSIGFKMAGDEWHRKCIFRPFA